MVKYEKDKRPIIEETTHPHLSEVLGEQEYKGEKIVVFRELLQNALDSGATKIEISLKRSRVTCTDNGEGVTSVNEFMVLGTPYKVDKRGMIGFKGIGRKAYFMLSDKPLIFTRGKSVVECEDRKVKSVLWEYDGNKSYIIAVNEDIHPEIQHGTCVEFPNPKHIFRKKTVISYISELLAPLLREDKIKVYVNGVKVSALEFPKGISYSFEDDCKYGHISSLIIDPEDSKERKGIRLYTKGFFVKRDFIDPGKPLTGEVEVPFLTPSNDRADYVRGEELDVFYEILRKDLSTIKIRVSEKDPRIARNLNLQAWIVSNICKSVNIEIPRVVYHSVNGEAGNHKLLLPKVPKLPVGDKKPLKENYSEKESKNIHSIQHRNPTIWVKEAGQALLPESKIGDDSSRSGITIGITEASSDLLVLPDYDMRTIMVNIGSPIIKDAMLSNSKFLLAILCYFILNEFAKIVLPLDASSVEIESLREQLLTTVFRFLHENEKRIDHYLKIS